MLMRLDVMYPPSYPLGSLAPADTSYESLDSAVSPKSQIFTHHTHSERSIRECVPLPFKSTSDVGEIWNQEKQARATAEQAHVRWLHSNEGRYHEREHEEWIPTWTRSLLPLNIAEEIDWGAVEKRRRGSVIQHIPSSVWDEYGSLSFDFARAQQEAHQQALSHLEFDVEGNDAHGKRIRAQRILEVWLDVREYHGDGAGFPNFERSTMKMKNICILRPPHPQSFRVATEEEREPYQIVLERLAHNEVDKVLDEREHFLRGAFANEEHHVQDMCDILDYSTLNWTFAKPRSCGEGTG